jgi:deoxyadenosine/deoxycytidine kinase
MGKLIQAPDLIIYLRASIPTLVKQIQKRGRDYENTIRLDYLNQLNQRYEAWASRYNLGKMLIVNVDELNFAENAEDLSKVIDKIDAQLHGLF